MQPMSGPITFPSTGDITVPLPATPTRIEFTTGGKWSVNETTNSRSGQGHANPSYQWATANLSNASGYFSRIYPNTQAFAILDGASGNPVVLGKVKTWSSNLVFTITNANSNWPVFMTVHFS